MTFKEFNQLTNNTVDWLKIINNVFSKLNSLVRVKSDEPILVGDIEYFKAVTKLMNETPKRVIANHFGWIIAYTFGPHTTQAFRDASFEFSHSGGGEIKERQLWQDCLNIVTMNLRYAVSRLYIDTSFSRKDKDMVSCNTQNTVNSTLLSFLSLTCYYPNTVASTTVNKPELTVAYHQISPRYILL